MIPRWRSAEHVRTSRAGVAGGDLASGSFRTGRTRPKGTKPGIRCTGSSGPDSVPQPGLAFAYLLNTACTEVLPVILSAQVVAVPEHAPLQFANVLPRGGVAVSVTIVP